MTSPFEDAFRDLRISGSVLLTGTHAARWAVDVPGKTRLRTFGVDAIGRAVVIG